MCIYIVNNVNVPLPPPSAQPRLRVRRAKSAAPLPPCTISCGKTPPSLGARAPARAISAEIRCCCSCKSRRSRACSSSPSSYPPSSPASHDPRGALQPLSGGAAFSATGQEEGWVTWPELMSLLRKPEGPCKSVRREVLGGRGERCWCSGSCFDGTRAGANSASLARCRRRLFNSSRAHLPSQHRRIAAAALMTCMCASRRSFLRTTACIPRAAVSISANSRLFALRWTLARMLHVAIFSMSKCVRAAHPAAARQSCSRHAANLRIYSIRARDAGRRAAI